MRKKLFPQNKKTHKHKKMDILSKEVNGFTLTYPEQLDCKLVNGVGSLNIDLGTNGSIEFKVTGSCGCITVPSKIKLVNNQTYSMPVTIKRSSDYTGHVKLYASRSGVFEHCATIKINVKV
jgi:hypothetical protein